MGEFKTKTIIFFTLSVIFALAAAYIFLSHVRETEQSMGELVPVVIAREDIPANTIISEDKLETTNIPRKYISASLLTDLKQASNLISLVPIKKQDIITHSMVRAKEQIPSDYRVVYLREPIAVFDGVFSIGDRVDLYATFENGDGKSTALLQSNVEVVSLVKGKEEKISSIGVSLQIDAIPWVVQTLNGAKEVRVLKRPLGN